MKSISLSVSESEYDRYRKAAKEQNRSIAQLLREAMVFYRKEKLDQREPLHDLPVLVGHRPRQPIPSRHEIYEDVFAPDDGAKP